MLLEGVITIFHQTSLPIYLALSEIFATFAPRKELCADSDRWEPSKSMMAEDRHEWFFTSVA